MKLAKIVDKKFQKSFNTLQQKEIPAKTSYMLATIGLIFSEEHKKYEEVRRSLVMKYGNKNKDGSLEINPETKNINFTQDNLKRFMDDLNELLSVDVQVPAITLDSLGNISLPPDDMLQLYELFTPQK